MQLKYDEYPACQLPDPSALPLCQHKRSVYFSVVLPSQDSSSSSSDSSSSSSSSSDSDDDKKKKKKKDKKKKKKKKKDKKKVTLVDFFVTFPQEPLAS